MKGVFMINADVRPALLLIYSCSLLIMVLAVIGLGLQRDRVYFLPALLAMGASVVLAAATSSGVRIIVTSVGLTFLLVLSVLGELIIFLALLLMKKARVPYLPMAALLVGCAIAFGSANAVTYPDSAPWNGFVLVSALIGALMAITSAARLLILLAGHRQQ